jgi:hypothetical protein
VDLTRPIPVQSKCQQVMWYGPTASTAGPAAARVDGRCAVAGRPGWAGEHHDQKSSSRPGPQRELDTPCPGLIWRLFVLRSIKALRRPPSSWMYPSTQNLSGAADSVQFGLGGLGRFPVQLPPAEGPPVATSISKPLLRRVLQSCRASAS